MEIYEVIMMIVTMMLMMIMMISVIMNEPEVLVGLDFVVSFQMSLERIRSRAKFYVEKESISFIGANFK